MIKTKVLLPHTYVTFAEFGYFGLLLPKACIIFGFLSFRLWAYLMKVIPETRRAH